MATLSGAVVRCRACAAIADSSKLIRRKLVAAGGFWAEGCYAGAFHRGCLVLPHAWQSKVRWLQGTAMCAA